MKQNNDLLLERGMKRFAKDYPDGHPIEQRPIFMKNFIKGRQHIIEQQERLEIMKHSMSKKEFDTKLKEIREKRSALKGGVKQALGDASIGEVAASEATSDRFTFDVKDKVKSIVKDIATNTITKDQMKDRLKLAKTDPLKDLLPPEPVFPKKHTPNIKQKDGKFSTTAQHHKTQQKDGKFTSNIPERTAPEKQEAKETNKESSKKEKVHNPVRINLEPEWAKEIKKENKSIPAKEKPTSSLGTVGKSFAEKINKIDTTATEALFKPVNHITKAERDSVMKSPVYKDKTSPFFNAAQKVVKGSFKHQYPGKSRGYHNIREASPLPKTPTPLRDPTGKDVNKEFGNTLAREVEKVGEPKAVKAFQRSMNEIDKQKPRIADVNVPWIAPKRKPLKEDGVFGPKTKIRMQEVGATHGVSPVLNTFRKKIGSFL